MDKSSHKSCSIKKVFLKFRKIHRKTPVPEPLFKKETLVQVFSREFCKTLMNTFLTEHLRVTASKFCNPCPSLCHVEYSQLSF